MHWAPKIFPTIALFKFSKMFVKWRVIPNSVRLHLNRVKAKRYTYPNWITAKWNNANENYTIFKTKPINFLNWLCILPSKNKSVISVTGLCTANPFAFSNVTRLSCMSAYKGWNENIWKTTVEYGDICCWEKPCSLVGTYDPKYLPPPATLIAWYPDKR